VSKISYRVKDLNDGTFLNNDHSDWDPHTFTSFATLEEAKNAVKDWGGSGCKLVIVKVTSKPTSTTNGHDWAWALKQLHKGKKVRRLDWLKNSPKLYVEASARGELLVHRPEVHNPFAFIFGDVDCDATDWVLVGSLGVCS